MNFEEWIKSVHVENLTDDAYELAKFAWQEAQEEQRRICVEAIQECELVAPNVRRIRLDEAVGACISAKSV